MSDAGPARQVLDLLTRAAHDRNAGVLRWPVLATAQPGGGADARMLVLRRFDRAGRVLELHTDIRSPKCTQLERDPACTLVFFDPRSRVQLRVSGSAVLHHGDEPAAAALASVAPAALTDYAGPAPGAPFAEAGAPAGDPEANFAVIRVTLLTADWLKLDGSGHERWRVEFQGDGVIAERLAP